MFASGTNTQTAFILRTTLVTYFFASSNIKRSIMIIVFVIFSSCILLFFFLNTFRTLFRALLTTRHILRSITRN